MTPPNNSTSNDSNHVHNSPVNDQIHASSTEEHPRSQNATLSRQGSQETGTLTAAQLDEIVVRLRNIPRTGSNLSMNRSDSNSTDRTSTTVHCHIVNTVPIEPQLYMALVSGEKDKISNMGGDLWEFRCKVDKNSVVHIAACAGQAELIKDIIPRCKDIIKWKNSKGDLAFHCAAKSGQLESLKALIDWNNYVEAGVSNVILREGNDDGDTALHIALENNQTEMALCLVKECPETCYELNKKRVSPLYIAIKLRYWQLVTEMINYTMLLSPASEDGMMLGKSVIHAAIEAESIEVLKALLENHGKLIDLLDDGLTALSYAAFKGYLCGVKYLLSKEFAHFAYKCNEDEDNSFPVHQAARGGHIKAIKQFHNTKHLLNRNGQNILHVAASNGKAKVVSYLLNILELERLINLKDEDGNTPLHLATKGFHPRVVYILTREARTKLELHNKDGLTALDVAEIHAESCSTFEARLTWMALRYVDAPRSLQSTRQTYFQQAYLNNGNGRQNRAANDKIELENFKNRIDTFLLVATLVATVTFAAGFTAPGGYKQDDPDIGMAVLDYKWPFQIFIICNTAALYSSILSVVSLIWAYLGDLKLILVSIKIALPLLGFALTMMSLAFTMGIFVGLRTLPWLSYVIVGMGSVFLLVLLVLFIPLYNPSYIRNPLVRFLFSGPFLLLLLVCEKSTTKYA